MSYRAWKNLLHGMDTFDDLVSVLFSRLILCHVQHQIAGLAKQDAIVSSSTTASVKMPPPPPKFIPPPPKFAPATVSVEKMPPPKPALLASGNGATELKQDGADLVLLSFLWSLAQFVLCVINLRNQYGWGFANSPLY